MREFLIDSSYNNFVNYENCRLKKRHTYDILYM